MAEEAILNAARVGDDFTISNARRPQRFRNLFELPLALVEPKMVGLQTIVGNINVNFSILVQVCGGDTASGIARVFRGPPHFLEGAIGLIEVDRVWVDYLFPDFIATHKQIQSPV